MITEKNQMKTEAIFSDDRKHRILLRKDWASKGIRAMVLMLNPASANIVSMDTSSMLVVNNLNRLSYSGCDITNLFSLMTTKLSTTDGVEGLYLEDNFEQIQKSAESCDTVILAVGSLPEYNRKIKPVMDRVLDILRHYESKLYVITDAKERKEQYHPLCPEVRSSWKLKPYRIPEKESDKKNDEDKQPDETK